jgi:hypothetical protein
MDKGKYVARGILVGLIFGLLLGGAISSYVYVPKLKCAKQVVAKETKRVYPIGTFEHEVKRTE